MLDENSLIVNSLLILTIVIFGLGSIIGLLGWRVDGYIKKILSVVLMLIAMLFALIAAIITKYPLVT